MRHLVTALYLAFVLGCVALLICGGPVPSPALPNRSATPVIVKGIVCPECTAAGRWRSCREGGCKKCSEECCRRGADKCCCLDRDLCECEPPEPPPPVDPTAGGTQ